MTTVFRSGGVNALSLRPVDAGGRGAGPMIATIKVLGLKARDFATVAAAARRVVEYVQGGPVSTPSNAAAYYAVERSDEAGRIASGTSRGSAAPLVGLRGPVNGEQLHRLLLGQHARTGMWLLAGRGSAGRTQAQHGPFGPALAHALSQAPEVMTLAQAARIAGVSVRYLRRLAENHELAVSADSSTEAEASGTVASGRVDSVALSADAGGSGPLSAEDSLFSQPQRRPRAVGSDRDVLRAFRESGRRRWLVSREELGRFMAERQPPTVVIGYDMTCSAPKSVSLLWAFGDPGLRADIQASLDAGIDAAFGYLERYAAVGTVGGRNQLALGLAAACYRHEISRSEEAHLHVHNIVVNAVPVPVLDDHGRPVTDDGGTGRVEWRALDGEVLMRHVKTAGYIGAATLRHELARRRGLEWGPVRNGVAELADFPKAVLEAFSTRHGELTEEFMQLVDAGFTADAATLVPRQSS